MTDYDKSKLNPRLYAEIHRVHPRVYDLSVLPNHDQKNHEKLWNFYLKSDFVYEAKLNFLSPLKKEIDYTLQKLLECKNDTCEYFFIADEKEIIGSVMAVQYTNHTWMVQHIVVLPEFRRTSLAKELILSINSWMVRNREMKYFINYFQPKTRWAYKTYYGILNQMEDKTYMGIERFSYLVLDLKAYKFGQFVSDVQVREILSEEEESVYKELLKNNSEILINSLGLTKDGFSIDKARENYKNLNLIRDRKYFVAILNDKIVGFAFVDISSFGISLSLLFNVLNIYVFEKQNKEEIIFALSDKIHKLLKENNRIYAIVVIKEEDQIIYEKLGYIYSRTYLSYTFSRDNDQFLKTYDIVNSGKRWKK